MELWVIGQSDTYSLQAKNKKVKRNNLKITFTFGSVYSTIKNIKSNAAYICSKPNP